MCLQEKDPEHAYMLQVATIPDATEKPYFWHAIRVARVGSEPDDVNKIRGMATSIPYTYICMQMAGCNDCLLMFRLVL